MNDLFKKNSLIMVVVTALFASLVFVSNFISIPIPVAIGSVTRIHLGNAFCLLSGLILGPIGGGLAAGLGSALYDLLTPAYVMDAPFTFVFKFILATIPGLFMYLSKKKSIKIAIIGVALGQISYIILYIGKNFFIGILQGSAPQALVPSLLTMLASSCINAVIAVIIVTILYGTITKAMKSSKLLQ